MGQKYACLSHAYAHTVLTLLFGLSVSWRWCNICWSYSQEARASFNSYSKTMSWRSSLKCCTISSVGIGLNSGEYTLWIRWVVKGMHAHMCMLVHTHMYTYTHRHTHTHESTHPCTNTFSHNQLQTLRHYKVYSVANYVRFCSLIDSSWPNGSFRELMHCSFQMDGWKA